MTTTQPPALTPPTQLLDQLDALHAAADTPSPWLIRYPFSKLVVGPGEDGTTLAQAEANDAALIVAAVNALPQLTAALRAALHLADEYERRGRLNADPTSLDSRVHQMAADRLRDTITAALTPADPMSPATPVSEGQR